MAERTNDERPDARELGGTSEETMDDARETPPEREAHADAEREKDAEVPGGPPRRDDLPPEPGELGRRFLEDATQQPQEHREYDQTEREGQHEDPAASVGERQMRGQSPEASDEKDRLVTHMPDRTAHEERVSRESREKQKEQSPEDRRDSTV